MWSDKLNPSFTLKLSSIFRSWHEFEERAGKRETDPNSIRLDSESTHTTAQSSEKPFNSSPTTILHETDLAHPDLLKPNPEYYENAVVKLLKLHMDLLAAHNHWQTKCSNQMIHLRRLHLYYIQKLFTNPKSQATRRNYVATRKLHITDDKSEFTGNKSKHKSHVTSQMT